MKIDQPAHKPMFGKPVAPWHWWFAWRPVFTWDNRLVWLVPVKRRRIQKHSYLSGLDLGWMEYHFPWGYCDG